MNQAYWGHALWDSSLAILWHTGNESSGIDLVYSVRIFGKKFPHTITKFLVCNRTHALLMKRVPHVSVLIDVNNCAAAST
jgi:hypothetical protein